MLLMFILPLFKIWLLEDESYLLGSHLWLTCSFYWAAIDLNTLHYNFCERPPTKEFYFFVVL